MSFNVDAQGLHRLQVRIISDSVESAIERISPFAAHLALCPIIDAKKSFCQYKYYDVKLVEGLLNEILY
jgi:hypothetical protein